MVVGGDAVELSGGLVVVGGPVFACVVAYLCTAVVGNRHALVVIGVYPEVVVVAMGRLDAGPVFAAVVGAPEVHVGYIDLVFVFGIGVDAGVVPGALPQLAEVAGARPGFPAVVGPEYAAVEVFHTGPKAVGIDGRDGNADDANSAFGHPGLMGEFGPGIAPVGAFPEVGPRASAVHAVAVAADFPGAGVQDAGVVGVEDQVHGTGFFAFEEDALPGVTAVFGAINPPFLAGFPEVAHGRYIDQVGVMRVYPDAPDVLGCFQSDGFPGLASIRGAPEAPAGGYVSAYGLLAFAHVEHVGVAFRYGYGTDGASEESVGDTVPGLASILGAPDASACRALVVEIGLVAYSRYGTGASAAEGPYEPPFHAFVQALVKMSACRALYSRCGHGLPFFLPDCLKSNEQTG